MTNSKQLLDIHIQLGRHVHFLSLSVLNGATLDGIVTAFDAAVVHLAELDALVGPIDLMKPMGEAKIYLATLKRFYTVVPMLKNHPQYLTCYNASLQIVEILQFCAARYDAKAKGYE